MATFPSINPTYNTKKSITPNTRTVRFADGYEHRIIFGVPEHQIPKIYNLTFNVSLTEANTIMAFLDARYLDSASFDFTPPNGTQGKYVCEKLISLALISLKSLLIYDISLFNNAII